MTWRLFVPVVAALLIVSSLQCQAQSYNANLLVEPGFENVGTWVRYGTLPASQHWWASWINWGSQSRTGVNHMIFIKHSGYEPKDDTTPAFIAVIQNVSTNIIPGTYQAYVYYKNEGTSTKWDGYGGNDQFIQLVVYCWSNTGCTELVKTVTSAKIESKQSLWAKLSVPPFTVSSDVKGITVAVYAQIIERWNKVWVQIDDAYLACTGP